MVKKSAETDIVEKMMQDKSADFTLEEMTQVGQLVKSDKIESTKSEKTENLERTVSIGCRRAR